MVGGIDDSGSVGAGKDVGSGQRSEGPQHCGLGAKGDFLTLAQGTWGKEIRSKHKHFEWWVYQSLFGSKEPLAKCL